MIEIHAHLIFIGAVIVLVLAPGPDMAYMLTRTIAQGRRAGFVAAVGINTGAYVHVVAAVLGLSAILATSSLAFTIVKLIGACYLIWIGLKALTKDVPVHLQNNAPAQLQLRTVFWQGFLSDVLNPKVAFFFLAFLPQFVDHRAGNEFEQLLVLGVTGNVVALTINVVLVYFASAATARLRRDQRIIRWLHRATGAVFIALGIRLANERL